MIFSFVSKPPLYFGAGAVAAVGEKASGFGWKKVILVCDKGIKAAGILDKVTASLDSAGVIYVEYDGVLPDPVVAIAEEAAALARREQVDGVVAVGGGSVIDVGKCVSVLLTNPSPINLYLGFRNDVNPGAGSILIPTTAGTGSEVSGAAVVTDTSLNIKIGVSGEHCKAKLAIIDPELTYKLPPALTAQTALDAFAHGFEAFTGSGHNPMSDMLAKETMRLVAENLPLVMRQPDNLEGRANLCLAATLGGMSFGDSMCHLGHTVGENIAVYAHIPHGLSCALGMLAIISYIADVVPARVRWAGVLLGLDPAAELSDAELGAQVTDRFRAFVASAGVPTTLSGAGVSADILEAAAKGVETEPVLQRATPKFLNAADALKLMRAIY
ncbi:MAG: iron-containing alcohol dehydrogenase [Clostridiales Family XIII bacterium]|jgi:alcohol dehydrogenase class IV|nr:iron-containing alcohol dehydrogenase [Clostridiales Family XIII bacterium]